MINKQRTSEATKTTSSSSSTTTTTTSATTNTRTSGIVSRGGSRQEEPCSHNVYIKGLCGNCGARLDPPQSSSAVSMVHSVPELKVTKEYAKEIGKADQESLINERKLVLLVDLDQTILHTTHEEVRDDPNVHSFILEPGHPTYYTKLRPYLQEFLDEMIQMYELHIFTFGCRLYAHKIASIIDPDQRYFGNRILSRNESVDPCCKKGNLINLFPRGDAMVCIIDDRSDVWLDAGNLIQVKAYSYFKTSISDGAMRRAATEEDDAQLDCDADKLQALLDLDDEFGEAREATDNDEDDDNDNKGRSEEQGTNDDENSEAQQDNSGKGEKSKQEQESSTDELEIESEKKIKKSKEEIHEQDGDKNDGIQENQKDIGDLNENDNDSEDSSEVKQGVKEEEEDDENKTPSSSASSSPPKIEEDRDDYLLVLIDILKRIHEKWYMELDESREFLTAEESYKLPAVKDIISRYFRKRMSYMDALLAAGFLEPEFKMVFVVNMELDMGRGKQCAQVAHAAIGLLLDIQCSDNDDNVLKLHQWLTSGQKKIVVRGQNIEEMNRLKGEAEAARLPCHLVADAGHTQIAPGSKTVLAIFGSNQDLDRVTGSLRLL